MAIKHFILATAGHVDHGKSSLVKALTGIDPDRLPEEKARGITIDLGFASLALESAGDGAATRFELGIVDVPGHEGFVRNMVAGVGSIDLALLVVAADDGWMPQTEEHLQILTYLGVRRAVIALTKADLVQDEPAAIAAIRDQLRPSPFPDAPIVPTSIPNGRGLDALKIALVDTLRTAPLPRDLGKPRLWVDRVFMLRGLGQVVTGTLLDGRLQKGQECIVQPSGAAGRIRSVQNHHRDVESNGPGMRTALNLPDLKGGAGQPLARGDVITLPSLGDPTRLMDVLLEKSARLRNVKVSAARPLKDGTRVRIHVGSSDAAGQLILLESHALAPGERGFAQIRLEQPLFVFAGDRFIVRDWSEETTLAGGVVLNAQRRPGQFRTAERGQWLEARANALENIHELILTEVSAWKVARAAELLVQSRFSAVEIARALEALVDAKRVVRRGDWAIDDSWWRSALGQAAAAVEGKHRTDPASAGLPLAELKAALDTQAALLFEPLVQELLANGFTQSAGLLRRTSHRPALPPHLRSAGDRLRRALTSAGLEPPSRKELAPDGASQQALKFLLDSGEAVALSAEIVLQADAYAQARETVEKHLHSRGSASASELRQVLGTSRRVVIPLLEKLDKDGLTRRDGDQRVLRKP